jgi:membrane protein required for colicin V production
MMEKEMDFHSNYMPVISFLAVFVVIALLIYLVGKSLEKIVEIAHLGLFNKIAGALLRIAIYTLVFSIFLWLINEAGLITPAVKIQSKTYDMLSRVSDYLVNDFSKFAPVVKNLFDESQHFFEKVSKAVEK